MRGYRLKPWQRVLIVLSIFWMIFGGVWGWRHANDRVDADFKLCLTQIQTASDVQECRAKRAAATVPRGVGAAVAAAGPVALFWLGLYALIVAGRRIGRAFQPEPALAVAAEPPSMALNAGPAPTAPKPEPVPTALTSGPVPTALTSGAVLIGLKERVSGAAEGIGMSPNKRTVEKYMDAFRRTDHQAILSCLTDDVEWIIPGLFHIKGKDAFDKEIENAAFVGSPAITVTRLTEESDVVVAEGRVRAARRDGGTLNAVFCDVFEMQDAKIRRLASYLMEVKEP
jgi:uncharacterized protein